MKIKKTKNDQTGKNRSSSPKNGWTGTDEPYL